MSKIDYISPWDNETFGYIDETTEDEVFRAMENKVLNYSSY